MSGSSDASEEVTPTKQGFFSRRLSAIKSTVGEAKATVAAKGAAVKASVTNSFIDEELDEFMFGLHGDHDMLEKRCARQAKGLSSFILEDEEEEQFKRELKAKRLRKQKAKRTFEEVVAGLEEGYFTGEFDPLEGQLEEASKWDLKAEQEVTDMVFMNAIEVREHEKTMVASELNVLIQKNYPELTICMKDVNAIDEDLQRTNLIISNSRRKLACAEDAFKGDLVVVSLQQKRERAVEVQQTIKSLRTLLDLSRSMRDSIVMDDFSVAAQCACHVLDTLRNDVYSQFQCIANISASTAKLLPTIKRKVDKALLRLCGRRFAALEYEQIVNTYMLLDHMSDSMQLNISYHDPQDTTVSLDETEELLKDSYGCLEGLSDRILRFQLHDIDTCVHAAVLENVYASQYKKQQSALQANSMVAGGEDIFGLTDCDINELFFKLSPEMVAPCVVRVCEFLLDAVHTHYCITQWHLSPFDPQNLDVAYLHRSPISLTLFNDDDEEEDDSEESEDEGAIDSNFKIGDLGVIMEADAAAEGSREAGVEGDDGKSVTNTDGETVTNADGESDAHSSELSLSDSVAAALSAVETRHETPPPMIERVNVKAAVTSPPRERTSSVAKAKNSTKKVSSMLSRSTTAAKSAVSAQVKFAWNMQKQLVGIIGASSSSVMSALGVGTTGESGDTLSEEQMYESLLQRKGTFGSGWGSPSKAVSMKNTVEDTDEVHTAAKIAGQSEISGIEKDRNHPDMIMQRLRRLERLSKARLVIGYQQMAASRSVLWQAVQTAMVTMLTSVQLTASMSLEDFLSVTAAIDTMIKLGKEFCGAASKPLVELLQEKSQEYFTFLHQNSFQMFRLMVDSELWCNVPINLADVGGIMGIIHMNIARQQVLLSDAVVMGKHHLSTERSEVADATAGDGTTASSAGNSILMSFGEFGNPFGEYLAKAVVPPDQLNQPQDGSDQSNEKEEEEGRGDEKEGQKKNSGMEFWNELLLSDGPEGSPRATAKARKAKTSASYVLTQSTLNGLAKFCGTYMLVMHWVPAISVDAYHGLIQMLEYYIAAVFYGLVPDDARELLMERPTKQTAPAPDDMRTYEPLQYCLERVMHTVVQMIGKKTATAVAPSTPFADDIPQAPAVNIQALQMSSLLSTPQVISDITGPDADFDTNSANMFALNERIIAAESCYFIAEMLNELSPKLMHFLPESYASLLKHFVSEYQLVVGQLTSYIYKTMCPMMINREEVLREISECKWESSSVAQGDAHAWVDGLVANCERVWQFLLMDDGNLPAKSLVKEQVWMEVCSAAFDTLLDGFCRVKKCSKEGRAAMGVDMSTLNAGLEGIHSSRSPHGKEYTEALAVKCSYMQDDEALRWIGENYQAYPYRCVLGIVNNKMSSMMNPKKLRDAVAYLDELYNLPSDEEEGKLSALMSKMSSSTNSSSGHGGGLGLTSGLSVPVSTGGIHSSHISSSNNNSNSNSPAPSSSITGGMAASISASMSHSMSNLSSSVSHTLGTAGSSTGEEGTGDVTPEASSSSSSSKFSLGNRMMRAARASIAGNIGGNNSSSTSSNN